MKSTCEAKTVVVGQWVPHPTSFIFVVYKQNVNASMSTHVCPSCENCANDKLSVFTEIKKIAWQKYTLWYILVCLYWPIFVNIRISSVHIDINQDKRKLIQHSIYKNGHNMSSWINRREIFVHLQRGDLVRLTVGKTKSQSYSVAGNIFLKCRFIFKL